MSRAFNWFVVTLLTRPLRLAIVLAATVALAGVAVLATVALAEPGTCSTACQERVNQRVAHTKWRKAVNAYGVGLLRARMRCESGSHGGYRLATTGNGFWFAMQWEPRAWYGSGGRQRRGRPAGVWTMQPSELEQNYRAVVWDHRHGGDAWPNCP